jgi:hypothetical protein
VTASLRDGTGAGGDVLTGVERIAGGRGDDRLTGDRHANGLYGHRGRDRLTGGAGADTLFGGSGADVLDGGRGDDTLHGEGGDRISCGPGADLVSEAQPADVLARDCEAIDLDFIDGAGKMRPNPVVRRGVARFLLPCPGTHGCRGSVHLRSAGAPTRRAFATRRRGRISVRVPLPLRAKPVRVDILVSLRGEFDEGSAAYSVRIPR